MGAWYRFTCDDCGKPAGSADMLDRLCGICRRERRQIDESKRALGTTEAAEQWAHLLGMRSPNEERRSLLEEEIARMFDDR